MEPLIRATLRKCCALLLGPALAGVFGGVPARAFPQALANWQARYGAISTSAESGFCQLCHANLFGGLAGPWNAYGWDMLLALSDPACDLDANGNVANDEALSCIELLDSDGDGSGTDNITEISLGTQPGWALGSNNIIYTRTGSTTGNTAPTDIGQLDPDDADQDSVSDAEDNCIQIPNGPAISDAGGNIQRDTDQDGFGNVCDADLNNDGTTDFLDLGLLKNRFFGSDPDADLNGDEIVDFLDLGAMKAMFFQPPGPSGLHP